MSQSIVDPASDKAMLRKQAAATRAEHSAVDPDAAGRLVAFAADIAALAGGGIVAAYLPIRSELSPLPLIASLSDRGLVTAMPVTPEPENPLTFHQWAPGDMLVDGPYKTKQPATDAPLVVPNVILAPMLAFDAGCWRLGYGGGFYDRTLGELRSVGRKVVAIGVAFDGQKVESVPTGPYDMALDAVLTPSGLIHPDPDYSQQSGGDM